MTSMPPPGHGDRPRDSWGWVAPGGKAPTPASSPPGSPPSLDPLSRRLLQTAGVLSGILIFLVAYTWSRDEGEHSLNPIAEAAARTQEAPGASSEIHAVYSIPGATRSVSMHGQGVYNGHTDRSRVTLVVPTPNGEVRMEGVGDGRTTYLRSKLLQPGLPPGDEWMAIESGLGRSSETSLASNSGPDAQLELLRAVSGDVETLGEETIGGVETTRYRGSFDLPAYARFLREEGSDAAARQYQRLAETMPSTTEVEAWVDGDELVRRVRLAMDFKDPSTGLINSMDMTEDFSDFGVAPDIALPDPATVFDATPLARAELGLLDGSNEMPSPPSSASPESAHTFHARARSVCLSVKKRIERMADQADSLTKKMQDTVREDGLEARSTLDAVRELTSRFYEPAIQVARRALARLAGITPPDTMADEFHRLLRLTALQTELHVANARALELGEYRLAKEIEERLDRLSPRIKAVANEIGLGVCEEGESGSTDSTGSSA